MTVVETPPIRLEESRLRRGSFQGPSAERPPVAAGARIQTRRTALVQGGNVNARSGGQRQRPE
jgi:hypothetical protein